MTPVTTQSEPHQASEQRPRKRVRMACNRCRRQKLKCDTQRPCALCTRSGVECVTDSRDLPWHKDQHGHPPVNYGEPPTTTSYTPDNIVPEALMSNAWPSEALWEPTSSRETNERTEHTAVPRNYSRDTSAVRLTQEILNQLSPEASLNTDTSALPGGSCNNTSLSNAVPIIQILGLNLPSKVISDNLINAYFESVHWFMVLFHEPTFRQRYDAIMLTGQASPDDLPFLVCVMLLLAIGARYIDPTSNLSQELADTDLDTLQSNLLSSTRLHLLDIVELGGVEVVQVCVLLSTFYLYHDRPNLAFAIHGMGVKCAHTMYLHQEAAWTESTALAREIKRRVWWAFFYAIIFGRPRSIRDEESHVTMVRNLEDTAARHPAFNSTENIGDSSYPVTIFSYQRYKFTLYTIAARVMRHIYFGNSSTSLISVSHTIRSISQDLDSWFQSLPPELKHPSGCDPEFMMQQEQEPLNNNIVRVFRLQAMALQLAYDNIQILLHRPLLQLPIRPRSSSSLANGVRGMDASYSRARVANEPVLGVVDNETLTMSKAQCYKSAVRTACLKVSIVKEAKHTHAASYIGIQMFTAGMVLSVVALSAPLSLEAQQAKRAIGQIVSTTASIGRKTLLSAQSQQVLRELVRLILEKEMNSIFAEPPPQLSATTHKKPTSRDPSQPVQNKTSSVSTQSKNDNRESAVQTSIAVDHRSGDGPKALRCEPGVEMQRADFTGEIWNDILPLEGCDYSHGISSVRQVFSQARHPQVVGSDWSDYAVNSSLLTESLQPNDDSTRSLNFAAPSLDFQGLGQAWLWEDGLLQPLNTDSGEQ
ncbi:fungal-specific transcription factor domain-containing protein [Fusarium sp. MPI-SDFR-AT-0072]|nr:fungal-specific transcription factor domain-containing protein [Fusarium sp. MPI-SDFR-AT-0072]